MHTLNENPAHPLPQTSREKDWMQAKSYPVGTGHLYYPPIS